MENGKVTRKRMESVLEPPFSKEVQECLDRISRRVLPLTEAEMKQYTAAELERIMPGVYNKFGYWRHSKDSDTREPLITIIDESVLWQ